MVSSVAPALTDIWLGKRDRAIDKTLDGKAVMKLCKCVDDYLLLFEADCHIHISQRQKVFL